MKLLYFFATVFVVACGVAWWALQKLESSYECNKKRRVRK